MTGAEVLEQGRTAYAKGRWADAYEHLAAADRTAQLEPPDLELLATAAYLLGHDDHSTNAWGRAHQAFLETGHAERAARCAFWVAFQLLHKGEHAQGSGWLARARRALGEGERDCAEQGYLLLPLGIQKVDAGENASACTTFERAAAIGERFGDADLMALARHGHGRALIRAGRTAEGMALLDEVMVAVTRGEASPAVVGEAYCSMLGACQETFDLRRAREWTGVLNDWCESQPALVPYRGDCLVRRAEILQLRGEWDDALKEAHRAVEHLSQPAPRPPLGAAYYREAELHRLRGEFEAAEAAYRRAAQWERLPRTGLAELRVAQGQIDTAKAVISRVVDEARELRHRSRVLGPYVDILLAANDVAAARSAAAELVTLAAELDALLLRAASAHATGAVLLADDDASGALAALRDALSGWRELGTPYEAARTRVLIGLACRALDDRDTCVMELDAARQVFQQLGAAQDVSRVRALLSPARRAGPLTAREVEVLRLVAAGKTNRAIADDLDISEKTVARHVSNMFTKMGVSSRAAATAYAYEHDLV